MSAKAKQEKLSLGLNLDHYNFMSTGSFKPVETSRPGVFVCGACQAPKDIPSSVVDSSAAALPGSRRPRYVPRVQTTATRRFNMETANHQT